MSAPILIFRLALVLEVLCLVGMGVGLLLMPEETNEEILRREGEFIEAWMPYLSSLPLPPAAWIIGGAIAGLFTLVAYIGFFVFWGWTRYANLVLTVLGLAITPFLGWTILPGWASALTDFASLLWGAILAMSFLPPVAERFGKVEKLPPPLPSA